MSLTRYSGRTKIVFFCITILFLLLLVIIRNEQSKIKILEDTIYNIENQYTIRYVKKQEPNISITSQNFNTSIIYELLKSDSYNSSQALEKSEPDMEFWIESKNNDERLDFHLWNLYSKIIIYNCRNNTYVTLYKIDNPTIMKAFELD